MTRTRKRILSVALAICMVVSLMPTALAASAEDFQDVSDTVWYYKDVRYVTEKGYFQGTAEGAFSPDEPMTRAMFVTVLSRLEGVTVSDDVSPFADVPAGAWYAGEVAWGADNELVNGVGEDMFGPDEKITRQQMATLTARYIAYYAEKNQVTFAEAEATDSFTDAAEVAAYAADAVALCHAYGLINGFQDGRFGPAETSTRAQVAAVIHRLALLLETGAPAGESADESGSGGGGVAETTVTNDAATAADFIKAAEANATNVTATILDENAITVNDDITITNNNVRTLTLNLGSASVGALTINSTSAKTITINGGTASVSSLTINAPNATVTNNVTVNGTVNIVAVSHNTFNNTAKTGTITVSGPAAVNDTQPTPAPVVVDTDKEVTVRGESKTINVVADGAKLTVEPTGDTAPKVESTAGDVSLNVKTDNKVTIAGTVQTVATTAEKPVLEIQGTVTKIESQDSSKELTLSGGGDVGEVSSASGAVTVDAGAATLTIEKVAVSNGSIEAPANVIQTVAASGQVELNAPVNTVEASGNTTLTLGQTATVNTLEAQGDLALSGDGQVTNVDAKDDCEITIDENTQVAHVTAPENVTVTATQGGTELTVTTKAAKPTGVEFNAPTAAGGEGTIDGVGNTMEYKAITSNTWLPISGTSIPVAAGTYEVRVAATETALASEPVRGVIPAAVGVTSAAIQGTPYVGQTLTAVANADATGTLRYQWSDGTTTIGTSKTYTLTDTQIGKTITVTISNYNGNEQETKTSAATAEVIVDKTALVKAIAKAEEVQQGVAEKPNDTTAEQVALGIIFVTTAEKKALTDAVTAASTVKDKDEADSTEVTGAEAALRAAIDVYVKAKKVGTLNEVENLQEALDTLIESAEAADDDVTTNTDAANVAPDAKWVLEADQTKFEAAIAAANGKKSSATATELSDAITALNKAITAYQKAIRKGAALDNSALVAAINAAEINAASVVAITSDQSGADVLPSQTWVTTDVKSAYTAAITTAKEKAATTDTQSVYTAALTALNDATGTFNTAKQAGTKDIVPPVVMISVNKNASEGSYSIRIITNEPGSYQYKVGLTGTWSTSVGITDAGSFPYTVEDKEAAVTIYVQVIDKAQNVTIVSVTLDPAVTNHVAAVDNEKYETLEAAIDDAADKTVTLLKNVTLSETLTIGKTVTLDLNGKTIETAGHTIQVNGDLTVGGGTVTNSQTTSDKENAPKTMFQVASAGSLHITDGTYNTATFQIVKADGDVTIEGGTFNCTNEDAGAAYDSKTVISISGTGATLTMTAGTINAPYGDDYCGLYGVYVQQGATAILGDANAKTGPSITTDLAPIGMNNSTSPGTIKVYGGTYTSNTGSEGKGGKFDCVVYLPAKSAVEIHGGTFTAEGDASHVISIPYNNVAVNLTITGGTFTSKGSNFYAGTEKGTESGTPTISITGGTFSDMSWTEYIADNATIKLGASFSTGDAEYSINAENVTLDLNGKTVTTTADPFLTVSAGAELTIKDTVGSGKLLEERDYSYLLLNKGKLTIESGDFSAVQKVYFGKAEEYYGTFALAMATDSETTIRGGTFTGALYTNGTSENVSITFEGGTFNSLLYLAAKTVNITVEGGTFNAGFEVKGSTIDIRGGTFNADSEASVEGGHVSNGNGSSTNGAWAFVVVDNASYGAAAATISGGTFNGPVALLDDDENTDNNNDSLTITGGEFTDLANAVKYAANGATIKLGADVTDGSGVIVDGSAGRTLTIDFGGHTYTVTKDLAGSSNTKNQCFQLLKGSTITMKNGAIATNNKGIKMVIQNYANLTLDGMTIDATQDANNIAASNWYVVSNNDGDVTIKNSSITAPDGAYVVDAAIWGTYSGAAVTIENSTIIGDMEVAQWSSEGGWHKVEGFSATPDGRPILKIKSGTFTDLVDAILCAEDGATIKLGANVVLAAPVDIDKDVTLDLNEKVLTMPSDTSANSRINVEEGKTLTVNGTGGTLNGRLNLLGNTAALVINGGEYKAVRADDTPLASNGSYTGMSITANNATFTGGTASGGVGAYLAGDGTYNFTNCAFTGFSGIEIRAGELNITAGNTITASGTPVAVAPNGNGSTSDGVGIAVAQHTTKLPITVNVSGGTISGYSAFYESNPQQNDEDALAKINLNITGGTFTAANGGTVAVYSENKTAFITGGTFSSDPSAYVADGYKAVESGGTWTVSAS